MAHKEQDKPGIGETCAESTRVAVETAVDLAKGIRRDKWENYRSRLRGKVNLWKENIPPAKGSYSIRLYDPVLGEARYIRRPPKKSAK